MNIEYSNEWFSVIKNGKYHFVLERNSSNGAAILIIEEHQYYIFVKQHRRAINDVVIEAPRGYGEAEENSLECAIREAREETGYNIARSNIKKVGSICPNSAILASKIDIFVANVSSSDMAISFDEEEIIEVVKVPVNNIGEWLASGKIVDGFTLSALALANAQP